MKRYICVILAAVLAAVLCGCGLIRDIAGEVASKGQELVSEINDAQSEIASVINEELTVTFSDEETELLTEEQTTAAPETEQVTVPETNAAVEGTTAPQETLAPNGSIQETDVPQGKVDAAPIAANLSGLVSGKTIEVYISGYQIVYTSASLSQRGTVTYGASDISYIEDETVWLKDVEVSDNNLAARIEYRSGSTASGYAVGYIPLGVIMNPDSYAESFTATGDFHVSLTVGGELSKDHWVGKGDTVYLLSDEVTRYCIMYDLNGGGYRIAYCDKGDLDKNVSK